MATPRDVALAWFDLTRTGEKCFCWGQRWPTKAIPLGYSHHRHGVPAEGAHQQLTQRASEWTEMLAQCTCPPDMYLYYGRMP